MRQKKSGKARIAWLLTCAMVMTLFAGVPVSAGWDEEYAARNGENFDWPNSDEPTEALYGLIATNGVPIECNQDAERDELLIGEDGFPLERRTVTDEDGNDVLDENKEVVTELVPMHYNDYATTSWTGMRLWMDYLQEAGGERERVTADELSVLYYGEYDPRNVEPEAVVEPQQIEATVSQDEQFPELIDFVPDKGGYYAIFYGSDTAIDRAYIIHVGDPDVGFYTQQNTDKDYLMMEPFAEHAASADVSDSKPNVVYMHINQTEDRKIVPVSGDPALVLQAWGDGYNELTGTIEDGIKDETNDYVSVRPLENDWYQLTISANEIPICDEQGEPRGSAGAFHLEILFDVTDTWTETEWVESEDPEQEPVEQPVEKTNSWQMNCQYSARLVSEGLAAMEVNGDHMICGEEAIDCGISPSHKEVAFYQNSSDENGFITKTQITGEELASMKLYKMEYNEESSQTEFKDVPKDSYEADVTDMGTVDFTFWRDGEYAVAFAEDQEGAPSEFIRLAAWLENVDFFSTQIRVNDDGRIEDRITGMTVDEDKSASFYVLFGQDDNDPYNIKSDTLKVTAENEDGKLLEGYLEQGEPVTEMRDEEGKEVEVVVGYEYIITENAADDFVIRATAERNGGPEVSDKEMYINNTMDVTINNFKGLEITKAPAKTTYTEGETFDKTGMVVTLVYEYSTEEDVTGYTVAPAGALKTSDKEVTISYKGLSKTLPITVKAKESTQQPTDPTTPTTPTTDPTTPTTTPDVGKQEETVKPAAAGTEIKDTTTKAEYTVTTTSGDTPVVAYEGTTDKKTKTVTVPATVEVNGVKYEVTEIADNAFKNNKTVTKITIGKNVTKVGKNAFSGCKNLKTVSVGNNVTTIEANAFKGCASLKTVTLPAKTTTIKASAFNGCKKLKTITIKSTKLTSKSIAKGAFKGLGKGTTIKVPKKKFAAYKKLFKQKGLSSNVKLSKY